MARRPSVQSKIKRPGALTAKAGKTKSGKVNQTKVRKLAHSSNPTTRAQANFYLNVLKPGAKTAARKRRKKKST